jgi:hypothetical protein
MTEAIPQPTPDISLRNIGRGTRVHERAAIRRLAVIWAHRLAGKFNKDIKLFLVGPQGSGKSRSAIYLAIEVAKEVSRILYGTPDRWEEFFPRDLSQVYIGNPEAHADALKGIKKHGIYILDDAGVSINARNFMTTYNKSLNDIFQTVRTDNALIIINAPDTFLIDNVPRNIVSFFGEVSESQHSVGLNFVKIFKLERKFRSGETHYHHYQFGNTQVVRWRFKNIPEDMVAVYERRRDEATQLIKSHAGEKKKSKESTVREELAQEKEDMYMAAYDLYSNGTKITVSISTINKTATGTVRINRDGFRAWMIKKGFVSD